MKQHFRGVIWPRQPIQGPQGPIYRYIVVGILAADAPLHSLDLFRVTQPGLGSTAFLDGDAPDLAEALEGVRQPQLTPEQALWLRGDASDILLSLGQMGEPE